MRPQPVVKDYSFDETRRVTWGRVKLMPEFSNAFLVLGEERSFNYKFLHQLMVLLDRDVPELTPELLQESREASRRGQREQDEAAVDYVSKLAQLYQVTWQGPWRRCGSASQSGSLRFAAPRLRARRALQADARSGRRGRGRGAG